MIAKSGDVSLFLVDFWTRFTALGGELMSGSPQTQGLHAEPHGRRVRRARCST